MWKYEICNDSQVLEVVWFDEEKARQVAKEISLNTTERITVIGVIDTGFAKGTRNIASFIHGVDESQMNYQVTSAKTKEEAEKKAAFFLSKKIPTTVKPDVSFGWIVVTSREHFMDAIDIYELNYATIDSLR